jgi:hypothetical protein
MSLDLAALREPFLAVPTSLAVLPAAEEAVGALVQLLYVHRVYMREELFAAREYTPASFSRLGAAPETLLLFTVVRGISLGDCA